MGGENLHKELRRALEDWNIVSAEGLLSADTDQNNERIHEMSMELVAMVCEYLTTQNEEAGPHFTKCCQDLLVILAQKGSAKENIISLLEHLEGFKELRLVRRVLPALSITLINIKDKSKSHAWGWALETLACHLKTIEKPENSGLEGAERLTLDLNSFNSDNIDFVDDLLPLLEPLVQHCSKSEQSKENMLRKQHLIKFILQVFGHPIAYLSQHPETSKSGTELFPRSYESSKKLITFISILTNDMLANIIQLSDDKVEDFDDNNISLGVYLYLVYGESICIELVPQTYSHIHLLRSCSKFLVSMMKSPLESLNHKALLLLSSLLRRMPEGWLREETSQDPKLTSLVTPLTNVIIHHNIAELRTLGFKCYQLLMTRFDVETRFNLYKFLFNVLNHSGLLGWTVTHFKNTLSKIYKEDKATYPSYTPAKLKPLFGKLYHLKHGSQTDLLEISDELIAEINLAYFVLCQKHSDVVEGVDIKLWCEQIQEGLKLSKAHWELELNNMKTNKSSIPSGEDPEMSISVGSQNLPTMKPEQKMQTIHSALTTLDVMQFNIVPLVNKLEQSNK